MTRWRGLEEREGEWNRQQVSQDSSNQERSRTFYEQLHQDVGNQAVQQMVEGDQRETGQQDTTNEVDTDRETLRRRFRQLRRQYCLNSPRVPGSNQLDALPEVAWRVPRVTERFMRAGLGPEILRELADEAWQEPDRVLNAVPTDSTLRRRATRGAALRGLGAAGMSVSGVAFSPALLFLSAGNPEAMQQQARTYREQLERADTNRRYARMARNTENPVAPNGVVDVLRQEVPDLVRFEDTSEGIEQQQELSTRMNDVDRDALLEHFESYSSNDRERIARAMRLRDGEPRRWPNGEPFSVIEERWPADFVEEHMDTLWQLEQVGSTSVLALDAAPVEKQALVEGLSELVQVDPELTDRAMNELPTETLARVGPHLATLTSEYTDTLVDRVLELGGELPAQKFERLTGELATADDRARKQHRERLQNLNDEKAREYLLAIAEGRDPESALNESPSPTGPEMADEPADGSGDE